MCCVCTQLQIGQSILFDRLLHSSMAPKLRIWSGKARGAVKKDVKTKSHARLDAFARGMIWGMHLAKTPRVEIARLVTKTDGTNPVVHAVDLVIARMKADSEWRGETDSSAAGRPASLTELHKKQLADLVFRERGKARVTIPLCKKRLPFLRRVSDMTVCRALHEAGLAWITRRMKTAVPQETKLARVEYCKWLLSKQQRTLGRFAYTDGTTFYLARTFVENADKKRAALGKHVWRMANGKDGLWDENVGPSLYAKGQGLPVKIWGFLGNGHVEYYVLPVDPGNSTKTTHMNGDRYEWLVTNKFASWRQACFEDDEPVSLVQDRERCLWQERNLKALRQTGCPAVDHPKHSPDLNAIEGWWKLLRQRLEVTEPEEFEGRAGFLVRLRRAATWLNSNRGAQVLQLCTNQKQRAHEVIALSGAKSRW
jgi:transposase